MSDHNSKSNKTQLISHEITAIQHIILDYIQKNNWRDYDHFSRLLSESILKKKYEPDLKKSTLNFNHPFYSFNGIQKKHFLEKFPYQSIINRLNNLPKYESHVQVVVQVHKKISKKQKKPFFTFADIFPEINEIDIEYAHSLISHLDISERILQDALREALKEKGATNILPRNADTPLEIADIEHFYLKINGYWYSFVCVVKGYRSLGKKKVTLEKIIHQIVKAYGGTTPDYLILVIAKELVDGVITQLTQYAQSIDKPELIIFCDPVDLTRFLLWRKIIRSV